MRFQSQEKLIKDARRVLESPFWIPEIDVGKMYSRTQDDHDGTWVGSITVTFSRDGDVHVWADQSLRFRGMAGGGNSPRVRNALMLLALAIKLDNEERPEHKPESPGV